MRFLVQQLNQLYGRMAEPEHRGLKAEELDRLKRALYEAQETLRHFDSAGCLSSITVDQIKALFFRRVALQHA